MTKEMDKLKNTQGITEIVMYPKACTLCQIGQDWYHNDFEIHFVPGEFYPDYMEVNKFISESIDGRELNIEDAVNTVYEMLARFQPKYLKVVDHVRDCKTHFNVDVVKE